MRLAGTLLLLVLATVLEVGGDATMRIGLRSAAGLPGRAALVLAGAVLLAAYGLVLNLAPLDWGRLVGAYVAVFFVTGQAINWLVFGTAPTASVLLGGVLIAAGGAVIASGGR